ncbi:Formate hydrogenlyase transcriptional activator [Cronobacter sakazakii]|nr:Formate hydrogenlyase transcriptional activator [Cronobacter sakazakii]
MSDLGQQGLFDITRTLMRQPDLCALAEALKSLLNASGMADRVNILLYHPKHQRTCFYSVDSVGNAVTYEDETVLSHGPVRRLLSRPEVLHCQYDEFGRDLAAACGTPALPAFGYYCLAPLAAEGHIFGGCEFIRDTARKL